MCIALPDPILLRLEARNVSRPISKRRARYIWDILGSHPDRVVGVVDGSGGVITPARRTITETELRVPSEAILWLVTGARDMNRAHTRAIEADEGSGREIVWRRE